MLSLSPFITGTHHGGVIVWAPMVLGHSLILYSMATDYELGLLRLIPLKLHLIFDGISGIILLGIARKRRLPGRTRRAQGRFPIS